MLGSGWSSRAWRCGECALRAIRCTDPGPHGALARCCRRVDSALDWAPCASTDRPGPGPGPGLGLGPDRGAVARVGIVAGRVGVLGAAASAPSRSPGAPIVAITARSCGADRVDSALDWAPCASTDRSGPGPAGADRVGIAAGRVALATAAARVRQTGLAHPGRPGARQSDRNLRGHEGRVHPDHRHPAFTRTPAAASGRARGSPSGSGRDGPAPVSQQPPAPPARTHPLRAVSPRPPPGLASWTPGSPSPAARRPSAR